MQFYIYLNGAKRGPFSEEQVHAHLQNGLLQPLDLASDLPDGQLRPLSSLLNLSAPRPSEIPAPATPPPIKSNAPALPPDRLGKYAHATLAPNETPVYRTSLHWIIFVRFALLGVATFLLIAMPFAIAVQALTGSQLGWFALPLPAFIMLTPTLAYVSSELVVTNMRVVIKSGIVRRQALEMFISKIESIAIDQSFLGRLLDYGTVVVRGTGGFEERFDAIAGPIQFRNWVQRMQKGGEAAPAS
ncbi:MAG: PH domain-containing protein [Chthoniobacterales bacterium]